MRKIIKYLAMVVCFSPLNAFADANEDAFEVKWPSVSNAKKYEVEIKDKDARVQQFRSDKNFLAADLKCGTYRYKVRSFDENQTPSPWGEETLIQVPTQKVELIYPTDKVKIVISNSQEKEAIIQFSWKALGEGANYTIEVMNEAKKVVFEKTLTENSLLVSLPITSQYTWHVSTFQNECLPNDNAKNEEWSFEFGDGKKSTRLNSSVSQDFRNFDYLKFELTYPIMVRRYRAASEFFKDRLFTTVFTSLGLAISGHLKNFPNSGVYLSFLAGSQAYSFDNPDTGGTVPLNLNFSSLEFGYNYSLKVHPQLDLVGKIDFAKEKIGLLYNENQTAHLISENIYNAGIGFGPKFYISEGDQFDEVGLIVSTNILANAQPYTLKNYSYMDVDVFRVKSFGDSLDLGLGYKYSNTKFTLLNDDKPSVANAIEQHFFNIFFKYVLH